jgi:DNA-binding GntR family transcriptional regulator
VSRTAYREAVRILAAKGLVHSRPRVGTRVSPVEHVALAGPGRVVVGFLGRTGARSAARPVRTANHRGAGRRGAGRDAAQPQHRTACGWRSMP